MEKIPADLEFKPDSPLSWSQQVGTAILQLMQDQAVSHVTWLIEVRLLSLSVCVPNIVLTWIIISNSARFPQRDNRSF
jgi:hypothetical protein